MVQEQTDMMEMYLDFHRNPKGSLRREFRGKMIYEKKLEAENIVEDSL
jgi:hypothetical protein